MLTLPITPLSTGAQDTHIVEESCTEVCFVVAAFEAKQKVFKKKKKPRKWQGGAWGQTWHAHEVYDVQFPDPVPK